MMETWVLISLLLRIIGADPAAVANLRCIGIIESTDAVADHLPFCNMFKTACHQPIQPCRTGEMSVMHLMNDQDVDIYVHLYDGVGWSFR